MYPLFQVSNAAVLTPVAPAPIAPVAPAPAPAPIALTPAPAPAPVHTPASVGDVSSESEIHRSRRLR
jgi:hypothetical protein